MSDDIRHIRASAENIWKHARKCKEDFGDCSTCAAGIRFFASLTPPVLSAVLEQRQCPPLLVRGKEEEKTHGKRIQDRTRPAQKS